MLERIRKYGFWTLDFLSGRRVKKHYLDIENKINRNASNKDALDEILDYATKNSNFYKNIENRSLSNFPVVNKTILRNEYDNIIVGSKEEKGLHWTHTSGSTGTPLELPQNADKRNRTKADLIFFNKKIGWELGPRYLFIRSWVKLYNVSKIRILAQNYIKVDTNTFNDENKEKLRKLLKTDRKIKYILSYSSAITDFANYLTNKIDEKDSFNIKLIVTASDELTKSAKKQIKKIFNCPVVNRISNEEHGLLAMQFDKDDSFTLNTASYYFEVLNLKNDSPARIGELGRLVVTDLYNRKFPLIRYDIGDLAVAQELNKDGSVSKLSSFEGRSSDVAYSDNGTPITSVAISTKLCTIDGILKYQVQTSSKEIIVRIVTKEDGNVDKTAISKAIKKTFGSKRKVIVKLLDDIPSEKNGKYRALVVK